MVSSIEGGFAAVEKAWHELGAENSPQPGSWRRVRRDPGRRDAHAPVPYWVRAEGSKTAHLGVCCT